MEEILGVYVTATLISAVVSVLVAVFALRRRHVPGAAALSAMMFAAAWWCAAYAGELLATSELGKSIWARSEYLGIALIGPCWLLFSLRYTGKLTRSAWTQWLLFLVPALTVLIALGGTRLGLIWTDAHIQTINGVRMYVVTHGPWFWINVSYAYACLLVGAVVLLTTVLSEVKPLTRQGVVLVLAVVLPWVANVLSLFWAGPDAGLDLTPLAMVLSGALVAVSLSRYGALQVFPGMVTVARDTVIQGMRDGVVVVGRGGVVLSANQAAERFLGVGPGAAVGRTITDFLGPLPEFPQSPTEAGGPRQYSFETTLGTAGDQRYVEVVASPLAANPRSPGLVLSMRDVTDRHLLEEELEHRALHDDLTGLPNRGLLRAHLKELLALQRRDGGELALLMLDLDRFKDINDTHGHAAGDVVLQAAARRLRESLRESDLVARLGGDEFAVILPGGTDEEGMRVAATLRDVLATPVEFGGRQLRAGASVGVAMAPRDGDTEDALMRHADVALYAAKEIAHGVAEYDPSRDPDSAEVLGLMDELCAALDEGRLTTHYQPVVSCADGVVVRVGAVTCWPQPDGGAFCGEQLLPLVARCDGYERVTRLALHDALHAARGWDESGWRVPVAVRLSEEDLHDASIVQRIEAALSGELVDPQRLWVEVAEKSVQADLDRAQAVLTDLRRAGIRVSIDGFGVGQSSLTTVHRLPADDLKLDPSFGADIGRREGSQAVVRAVVALAHELGLLVTADGVQDDEAFETLKALGCDAAQGPALARVMTAHEALGWAQDEHTSARE
jgi:diguanylate cyclase (GGDEF)-like protein/PAS domain S-box-containing protein